MEAHQIRSASSVNQLEEEHYPPTWNNIGELQEHIKVIKKTPH